MSVVYSACSGTVFYLFSVTNRVAVQMDTVHSSALTNTNHYMVQRHTEGRRFNKVIGKDLTFIKYIKYRFISCKSK